MANSIEDIYPNIARWVNDREGWIEIGCALDSPLNSFIRALDSGGMLWQGKDSYGSLDEALQELDSGLAQVLQEIYGE
ncbi:MAG: hypothetical protein CLLPBCKN_007668 [Chroococcidiopsis cubana SAG 39.79]|uniref:Uncharacterized protein n=1 Tax=Chroococcidiopsis cubana SAG 39.79 TaxID=388085 RepID=A0AB37USQ0_9CYAN|nr:hypothetical protein [Chroococcidiopsis cubana]MDZ4878233.1 hypothetical protein [Chroococcidiopsis cubana SAG 39.79]PSB55961.1 hypothetical protein C7B79_32810 [Chroococcidiopsis cubana CCALA 043]RUT14510.1 hypothetical protein DSM107010_00560 [Chroococcidiopsis cubana SAG 39.79]